MDTDLVVLILAIHEIAIRQKHSRIQTTCDIMHMDCDQEFQKGTGLALNSRRQKLAEELKENCPKFRAVPEQQIKDILQALQQQKSHDKGSAADELTISCTFKPETIQVPSPRKVHVLERTLTHINSNMYEHNTVFNYN